MKAAVPRLSLYDPSVTATAVPFRMASTNSCTGRVALVTMPHHCAGVGVAIGQSGRVPVCWTSWWFPLVVVGRQLAGNSRPLAILV